MENDRIFIPHRKFYFSTANHLSFVARILLNKLWWELHNINHNSARLAKTWSQKAHKSPYLKLNLQELVLNLVLMQEKMNLNHIWIIILVNRNASSRTTTIDSKKRRFFYHILFEFSKSHNLFRNISMIVWFIISLNNTL